MGILLNLLITAFLTDFSDDIVEKEKLYFNI